MIDIPKEGTKRYQICLNFIRSQHMTLGSYIEEYGLMGFGKAHGLRSEIDHLVKEKCLRVIGDKYMPTVGLMTSVKIDGSTYVEPRTAKPFRPMDTKHYLPRVSPRGQEIREITYIGMGRNVAAGTEEASGLSVLNEVLHGLQT
jgi:hypothetical protein